MNIQQALIEYPYIPERIQEMNKELNGIMCMKYETSLTQQISGMPGSGLISDPTLQAVERIVDMLDEYVERMSNRINRLMDAQEMIDSRLDRLGGQERRLIELKYIRPRGWQQVSVEMGYTLRQCYRIHCEALDKMGDKHVTKCHLLSLDAKVST